MRLSWAQLGHKPIRLLLDRPVGASSLENSWPDFVERFRQLTVRLKPRAGSLALGVQRNLEHTVSALHPHGFVLVRVFVE
jgi:hypothetical protein